MKRLLFLLSLFAACFSTAFAQLPAKIHNIGEVKQGYTIKYNQNFADTLKSGDTISYTMYVNHTNDVYIELENYAKVVAADTTATLTMYESFDGVNWSRIQAGSSPTDWAAKTIAKGTAYATYNGRIDIDYFAKRYVKLMYIAATKTGFKKVIKGTVKFNIR